MRPPLLDSLRAYVATLRWWLALFLLSFLAGPAGLLQMLVDSGVIPGVEGPVVVPAWGWWAAGYLALAVGGFVAFHKERVRVDGILRTVDEVKQHKINALALVSRACRILSAEAVTTETEYEAWKVSAAKVGDSFNKLRLILTLHEWNRIDSLPYENRNYEKAFNAEHRSMWNMAITTQAAIDRLVDDLIKAS